MPVYKSKRPGVWRIVVWIKGRPRETTFRGSKADAERREALLRLEGETPGDQRETPTLSAFCSAVYSAHAKLHLRKSTWTVRVYQLAALCAVLGEVPLTDLTTKTIDDYKAQRIADGLRASSVNNELRVLGTVLRFAHEQGYACADVKWKKLTDKTKPRVKVWTTEEVGKLYKGAAEKAPEIIPLLAFLANTGCRKGEATVCEWSWVDLKRRMLSIPATEFWQPKNGRAREVPISSVLAEVLKGQRGKHPVYVFPNSLGARYARFPYELFWYARKAAGISGSVHTLRHTYASHFLLNVPDLPLLGRILGHSSQRMTEIYTHLLPDHLDRAREAVSLAPPKTMGRTMGEQDKTARGRRKTTRANSSAGSSGPKSPTKRGTADAKS
jgi:integrase